MSKNLRRFRLQWALVAAVAFPMYCGKVSAADFRLSENGLVVWTALAVIVVSVILAGLDGRREKNERKKRTRVTA